MAKVKERMGVNMQKYKDINGDSGVEAYEYGVDYINVKFTGTPKIYPYTYESAGEEHIEEMKRLADIGDGLNAYINRNVRDKYVK